MHRKERRLVLIIAVLFALSASFTAAAEFIPLVIERNTRNSYDGFDFEFWTQNRGEHGVMTLTGGGTFTCEWEDNLNILFRTGKRLGSVMSYEEYGNIIIDYAGEHNITGGHASYLCVYGWTQNPLIEWYIIESRGAYKPPGGVGYKGTVEIDGGMYEIFESTRTEMPSIEGTRTFQQYWSVRTENRTEGIITVSDHFKAWEEFGMDMSGNLFEVMMCLEGFRTSGSGNITRFVLTIGDEVHGEGIVPMRHELEAEPDEPEAPEAEPPEPVPQAAPEPVETGDEEDGFPLIPVVAGGAAVVVIGAVAASISLRKKY
jgi:endo-1,4-beta-xylanase